MEIMLKRFFILSLLWIPFAVFGQKATISGYIQDASSGEKLIGASVYETNNYLGTTTNVYGFFSLTLDQGKYPLVISFIGYEAVEVEIDLREDTRLDVSLKALDTRLEEVEISAAVYERPHTRTQMSAVKIPMRQVERLPTFLGERDIMKMIQLLPGIQSGQEGSSGLYVRGGGPDQNLILLDGVPVYNASHLFGFFSVFNSSAINQVEILKGGFPARYGGRASSVLDIRMKEGNMKEFKGEASIGIIASKVTLEGPIWEDKTSFIISARRTYLDLITQPFLTLMSQSISGESVRAGYYFYDLNAKINHKFSDKSRFYASAYTGRDKAYANLISENSWYQEKYESRFNNHLQWGNLTTMMRYNYQFNPKLFANATATYSRYQFDVGMEYIDTYSYLDSIDESRYSFLYLSGIDDWGGKIDFDYLPSPNHYIRFGFGNTYHTFRPGVNSMTMANNELSADTTYGAGNKYAHEIHAYFEDDMKLTRRLKVNAGLYYTEFWVDDTTYRSLQPRLSLNFLLAPNFSYKLSYSGMAQFLHLLTNGTIGLPTDLWVPVTSSVPPIFANQLASGFAYTLLDEYEFSVEGYYKRMHNLIEYKDGASFMGSAENWDRKIEVGNGEAFGVEFFLQKKAGQLSGWLGYTLAWSNRQFEELNFGRWFPYKYDRRHDVSVALVYEYPKTFGKSDWKLDFGLTWVYGTGNAISLPTSSYNALSLTSSYYGGYDPYYPDPYGYNPNVVEIDNYENRNDFREPAYHRMDFSINFNRQLNGWEDGWNFSVYNVYNRMNPFYLYFQDEYVQINNQWVSMRSLKQISLFPLIPSISYHFKF